MALGDGCWDPSVIWDPTEHYAKFHGPRAGSWPYGAGCAMSAKNGLLIDSYTGKTYTAPPMSVMPYSQTWTSSAPGATPAPGTVLQPGGVDNAIYPIGVNAGGDVPVITVPYPACSAPSLPASMHGWDTITLDITVGTFAQVGVAVDQYDDYLLNYRNTQDPDEILLSGTPIPDSVNGHVLTAWGYNWSDEPWGTGSTGWQSMTGCVTNIPGSYQTGNAPIDTTASPGWTVSLWFKPVGSLLNSTTVFSLCSNVASQTEFRYNAAATDLVLYWQSTNTSGASATTQAVGSGLMPLGQWSHFVVTYNSSTHVYTYYVNGSLVGTANPGYTAWKATTLALNANYTASRSAQINFANVTTLQKVCSAADVTALYTFPASNPVSPVTAWWPLNNGTSRQRIVRTITVPNDLTSWPLGPPLYHTFAPQIEVSGANACTLNSWSVTMKGFAYTPVLTSYAGM